MRENTTSCFGDWVAAVYVYSSCLYVVFYYVYFFIFRTDCCTNPNPIHLKSYRDIYTSQEQMESWLHPISSSFWYPLRANIYWGSRSFPPEMRAAEILITRWTRMKCSFAQPLFLGLSGPENWTLQTNLAPAKKNISRAKLYCVRSPHFHQHVQVGPCFQGGYRVVGWYLGCPWGLKKIENKMCLCGSRHLFSRLTTPQKKTSRFSQCTVHLAGANLPFRFVLHIYIIYIYIFIHSLPYTPEE